MPETRRTNAGFLSNKEAARERQRIQAMVRNIAGTKQTEETRKAKNFVINPKFWSSNRGRIVTAIVINRAYDREALLSLRFGIHLFFRMVDVGLQLILF